MIRLGLSLPLLAILLPPAAAQDNGFKPLFNGKDFTGWQNAAGQPVPKGWEVKDGAMVRTSRAGDIWTKDRFGDFILDLEFKTEGNSGVFFRTDADLGHDLAAYIQKRRGK